MSKGELIRQRTLLAALRRWASQPADAEELKVWTRREQIAAWSGIGWEPARWFGEAWCGAWAWGVAALAGTGGPSARWRRRYGSSCLRMAGLGPRPLPEGVESVPAYGDAVKPGSIVTVEPRVDQAAQWVGEALRAKPGAGSHVTIALAKASGGGWWCIGGNQSGRGPHGAPVRSGVAVTRYAGLRRTVVGLEGLYPDQRPLDPAELAELAELVQRAKSAAGGGR